MPLYIAKDPTTSADELNHDLQTISERAYRTYHLSLLFNGNEHKHLCIILDTKLSLKNTNEKIIKAKTIIAILKHLSNYLPIKTLDLMYKLLVLQHFDYCEIIYLYHVPSSTNGSLNSLMEKIENSISSRFSNYWSVTGFQ